MYVPLADNDNYHQAAADNLDWAGKTTQAELLAEAKRLRLAHWTIQKDAGVDVIPSNDFALYDQVLSHIQDFGVSTFAAYFCLSIHPTSMH